MYLGTKLRYRTPEFPAIFYDGDNEVELWDWLKEMGYDDRWLMKAEPDSKDLVYSDREYVFIPKNSWLAYVGKRLVIYTTQLVEEIFDEVEGDG